MRNLAVSMPADKPHEHYGSCILTRAYEVPMHIRCEVQLTLYLYCLAMGTVPHWGLLLLLIVHLSSVLCHQASE